MSEGKLNPMCMTPADAARLLSKASGEAVSEDEVRQVIDAGAPTDANGNINIVHLGAWLLLEINPHAN